MVVVAQACAAICFDVIITMTSYWAQWRLKSPVVPIVGSTVGSDRDQRKHQGSASLVLLFWNNYHISEGLLSYSLLAFPLLDCCNVLIMICNAFVDLAAMGTGLDVGSLTFRTATLLRPLGWTSAYIRLVTVTAISGSMTDVRLWYYVNPSCAESILRRFENIICISYSFWTQRF